MKRLKRNIEGKEVIIYYPTREIMQQIQIIKESGDEKLMDEYFVMINKEQLCSLANRRRHTSLEMCIEAGYQFESEIDIEKEYEEKEEREELRRKLYVALKTLSADQKWLIKQIYVLKRTHVDIAAELGIKRQCVEHRLERILKKLKKVFI